MTRNLKRIAFAMIAATTAAIVIVAVESAISHILLRYAISSAPKPPKDEDAGTE
jgi:hypothetical protein